MPLLDWLEHCALPEEARLGRRRTTPAPSPREFIRGARSTPARPPRSCSASHFATAMDALFEAADRRAGCGSRAASSSATGCCAATCTRRRSAPTTRAARWPSAGTARVGCATPSRPASRSRAPTTCSTSCAGAARGRRRAAGSPRTSTRTRPRSRQVRDLFGGELSGQLRQARPGRAAQRVRAQRPPDRRRARTAGRARRARRALPDEQLPRSAAACSRSTATSRHGVRVALGRTSAPAPACRCSRRACRPTSCSGCVGPDGRPAHRRRTCCTWPPRPARPRSACATRSAT